MRIKESYSQLANEFKTNKSNKTFSKLYVKMKPGLYHYIYDFIKDKDSTEDVLSDTFSKVFTEIDKFDPTKGQITTWAFRIARNDCLSYIKKAKRKTSLEKFYDNGISPTSSDKFLVDVQYNIEDIKSDDMFWNEYNEINDKFNLAINSIKELSPLYRDIIQDRIVNKLDYKTIMFKHDEYMSKYKEDVENNKISESFYEAEYKKALQRIKNRIKRGREMLANIITEKYEKEML